MKIRAFWVIVHRWAGLTIALFLIVAGLTGSLLAFRDDLELLIAPQLHRVLPPRPDSPLLSPQRLRDVVMREHPGSTIDYLPLRLNPSRSVMLSLSRIDPVTGARSPWSKRWDEIYVNPYTGRAVGHRRWGDLSEGAVNAVPFVYRLHYTLALGRYGTLAFGVAALIWTIDCFVGIYLTFPIRSKQAASRPIQRQSWFARWRPAWRVRWAAGSHRLTFDLHRAGALWIWPLLLVFAWSAVSFNLSQVYRPFMGWFGYETIEQGIVPPAKPRFQPVLDFRKAEMIGRQLARQEAARFGLATDPTRDAGLLHRPDAGIYAYIFSSTADMRTNGGRSLVIFDSDTGTLIKSVLPQEQNAANTFTEWITAIHMADVWGSPWRVATALLGLVLSMLSVTGFLLWLRKRSARKIAGKRHRGRERYLG